MNSHASHSGGLSSISGKRLGILSHHVPFSSVHLGKQQPTSNIIHNHFCLSLFIIFLPFLIQCYTGPTADTSYETNQELTKNKEVQATPCQTPFLLKAYSKYHGKASHILDYRLQRSKWQTSHSSQFIAHGRAPLPMGKKAHFLRMTELFNKYDLTAKSG